MKNAMQLKAIIKNMAKEKHISAQLAVINKVIEPDDYYEKIQIQ